MGDAAMNVAASGGGSQRVVKEGWLQKRGIAKQFYNICVYILRSTSNYFISQIRVTPFYSFVYPYTNLVALCLTKCQTLRKLIYFLRNLWEAHF